MVLPLPWYTMAIVSTLMNGSTLGFIALRERNRALGLWSLGWFSWSVAVIPLVALGDPEAHPVAAVAFGLLWVVSSLFFLAGAYEFSARPMPRLWFIVAATCAVVAIVLGVGPTGPAGMVPLVVFQSVGLIAAGSLLARSARRHAGGWLAGLSLIGLGLHLLDAPALTSRPELFLWGFVVAIALQVLAALGMLMLYYEHAREQLVEAERRLAATRRMESLGRVAGGVAHDFNNMLTVMQGHVDLLRLSRAQAGDIDESLQEMTQAIRRARRLTQQLLSFGRQSVVQSDGIDVREVVRETIEMLERVTPKGVELDFRPGEGPYVAVLDQALLEQIVLNLVVNARDAVAPAGSIVVELEGREEPVPTLVIRVTDDGRGMDAETLEHIYEPFFSDKSGGRGTGLGLASVRGAVSQLGGEITVDSEVGRGTTFEVVLPWIPAPSTPEPPVAAAQGPLAVLVVDEDRGVRGTAAKILETAGHRVEQAADGREASVLLAERRFDLMISDSPAQAGESPAATPVVLTTARSQRPQDEEPGYSLPKPFTREELLSVVERAAARRAR